MTTHLITRLEEAAEGSRELDAEIATRFGWVHERRIPEFRSPKWWPPIELETKEQTSAYAYAKSNPPPVTTSIDAALALADRVLPEGWTVEIKTGARPFHRAIVHPTYRMENKQDRCPMGLSKASAAMALCIAILRANNKDKS